MVQLHGGVEVGLAGVSREDALAELVVHLTDVVRRAPGHALQHVCESAGDLQVFQLVTALGGDPSPQERAIIADTIKVMLYVGSLDVYLMELKSLVRKGRPHPVLDMRSKLASHVRENLKTLGLKRATKQVTLEDVLEDDHNETQDT